MKVSYYEQEQSIILQASTKDSFDYPTEHYKSMLIVKNNEKQ